MALAFANLGASANPDINSSTDATSYANTAWTPPNSLIVLVVYSREVSALNTVDSVTGNGITWTQIATVTWGSGNIHRLTLFGANGSGATNEATTIQYGADTQIGCIASFFEVTGADLSGGVAAAFVQAPTNSGAAALSGSVTLAAAGNSNNRPIAAFMHAANEVTTFATNWTELDDLAGAAPVRGVDTQYRSDAYDTAAAASWATSAVWGGIAAEIKAAGGGTVFEQAAAGTVTTAGVTARGTGKPLIGTATSAGTVVRATAKTAAGVLTSAGALTRSVAKIVAGTLTSAGTLVVAPLFSVMVAGTLTSVGTVTRTAGKVLSGVLTAAGGLSRTAAKLMTGALTGAGEVTRATLKTVFGTLTSAGALLASLSYFVVVAGVLTSSGTLLRATGKVLSGGLTPAGALSRGVAKLLAGVLTTAGALIRLLIGPSAVKLDVSLTDSAVTTLTLIDTSVTMLSQSDMVVITMSLSDTARS